ncbi:MAG: leucyl aminopeptidase [Buchnera aphidicola (Periphyllus acericola)]|uniref:leucyl aminopeptidase n=1 Tax=Buchnera aphidicola TaxID=9 RepID=UPI0030D05D55|nr:leucyl aminopeptidase [Buchnera aphidicola (Periphyllus acericola)]
MKVLPCIFPQKIYKNNCKIFGIYTDHNLNHLSAIIKKKYIYNIEKILKKNNLNNNFGKIILIYNNFKTSYERFLFINCGKKINFSQDLFIKIIKKIFFYLKNCNFKNIYINFSDFNSNLNNIYWNGRNFIDIMENVNYSFNKFKSNKNKNILNIKKIIIQIKKPKYLKKLKKSIYHGLSIAKGIKLTKDISNTPPNICNPKYLSLAALKLKKIYKSITTKIFNEHDLKKLGMNAFLSVSQGSINKAYMSIINYNGNFNTINKKPFILIGKGVTFDSGGISIKHSSYMDEMKYDMCGAASIIGVIDSIARLKLPINVIGIIGSCENMPGGKAYRPGDVIKTMSGNTVEVLNTDAEGRLILCDMLTYSQRFNPYVIIDVATLTGSCVSILGNAASGIFSNNKSLLKELNYASKKINEKVWNLPNFKIYKKYLQSNIADFSNVGGKYSGASIASYFLSFFVKKYKWAHLDIAGTAWKTGKNKGATGVSVKLLCQYFLNYLKNH